MSCAAKRGSLWYVGSTGRDNDNTSPDIRLPSLLDETLACDTVVLGTPTSGRMTVALAHCPNNQCHGSPVVRHSNVPMPYTTTSLPWVIPDHIACRVSQGKTLPSPRLSAIPRLCRPSCPMVLPCPWPPLRCVRHTEPSCLGSGGSVNLLIRCTPKECEGLGRR